MCRLHKAATSQCARPSRADHTSLPLQLRSIPALHLACEFRVDLVRIDTFGNSEGPLEGTVTPLRDVVVALLTFFVFFLFLAADRQSVPGEPNVDVLLVQARQLRSH